MAKKTLNFYWWNMCFLLNIPWAFCGILNIFHENMKNIDMSSAQVRVLFAEPMSWPCSVNFCVTGCINPASVWLCWPAFDAGACVTARCCVNNELTQCWVVAEAVGTATAMTGWQALSAFVAFQPHSASRNTKSLNLTAEATLNDNLVTSPLFMHNKILNNTNYYKIPLQHLNFLVGYWYSIPSKCMRNQPLVTE